MDRALASLSRRQPPLSSVVLDLSKRLLELLVLTSSSSSSLGNTADDDLYENEEYARGILRLMDLGSSSSSSSIAKTTGEEEISSSGVVVRWEPLAVGLRLVVDYLEKKTNALPKKGVAEVAGHDGEEDEDNDDDKEEEDEGTGLGTGGGGVYAEGPRIPKIATGTTPTGVDPTKPTTTENKSSSPPPSENSPVFELMLALPTIIDANVEHSEPRVRSLVAQTVGAYARFATSLLNWLGTSSHGNADKLSSTNNGDDEEEEQKLVEAIHKAQVGRRSIHSAILISLNKHLKMKEPIREEGTHAQSKASDGALDDTTGWRALETNLHGLASYVDGCVGRAGTAGYKGGSYIAEEISLFQPAPPLSVEEDVSWFLSGLQHCCVVHVNRHVRAASAAVLGVLVKACMRSRDASHQALLVEVDSPFRLVLKETLRATLADNWSQVRMAGSVLCRRLVGALIKIHAREGRGAKDDDDDATIFESAVGDLVPMLLPRMCLNRFYLAQGVKLYSQETWKLVFGNAQGYSVDEEGLHSSEETKGGGGLGAVARNAAPVCRYYSKMCDADNHAVREAACQGVAELAQKVGKHPLYADHLSPYVTMLLQVRHFNCLHSMAWRRRHAYIFSAMFVPPIIFCFRLC